jgi:3-hydroxybutyryl-CoA dehydrogenase
MNFNVPTNFASRPVAVIGAGTLGRRIALMFAAHGAEVNIYDLAEAQRQAAVDYVSQNLPALAAGLTGVVPGHVSAQADLAEAVHDAWLVVEAIPERVDLKIQVFGQLDELAPADAICQQFVVICQPMF